MRSLPYSVGSLVGRQGEIRQIDETIGTARASGGGVLVVRGEAGVGKTALLRHAERAASGFRVMRAAGAEFESELPFAALHQLCRPLCAPSLGHLAELPAQHREALRVAFGLATGAPDFYRAGLAALELFAAAARDRPLLCVVDDAQWLDAASLKALAFVARRVTAEPVALVFAVRVPAAANELDDLPGLDVGRLSDGDARALLAANGQGALDEQVRDRIMAEARGNPLALLQLPRSDGFDGFAVPDTTSVPSRIERSFRARLAGLPEGARQLLTVASADPTGAPDLLWSAALRMDIDVAAAGATATATGLVEFSTRVRFCHPLARSAVYLAADAGERRRAHRVLAEVTDPVGAPDRRAWHRARGSSGPDEAVAAELERSASRARSRGGVVAAAAFAERAAELSLDPAKRVERTLAAVQARIDAGAPDAAARLLTTVETSPMDEGRHARVDLLRGQLAFMRHDDSEGPMFMVRAGRRLAASDPAMARRCFLDALEMSLVVGRADGAMDMVLAAAKPRAPEPRSPDILDALTLLTTEGHRTAAPLMRNVLDGVDGVDGPMWTERPALAVMLAAELWDPHSHSAIADWLMKTGRESGAPLVLRLGLAQVASYAALTGDLGRAMAAIAEEEAVADATGGPPVTYHRLQLAAMRGRRQEASELFGTAAAASGTGQLITNVHWAAAVLNNGLADYPAALAAAKRATARGGLGLAGMSLPELVEAAVRCDEPREAAIALGSLTERTEASGSASGLGIAAYARGLVTGVEDHYREALDHLDGSPLLPYRARAHLVYGEWLRRAGRRKDSRPHLRTAHELLSEAGMEAFARRAADELRATGEKARSRSVHTYNQLTMQEVHIARLVATGATSNEVAAGLFLSPRTVDAHLRNIFRKLGITSRRQLRDHPGLHSEPMSS
ncbi:ATP-binding protein [Streptomyces tsukubensis]|uniref:LuxR family transcriptional regulator n=1 Tax=Streptomyces tsukubensis TaxID=83656 RepID=A0A1V4A116_9ACTN|nr:LuxR family transcriptional regulator [Streptomyces tsukubensis]OON71923.1 LuxR family transcriptional regulator [Streptomyces tsukubensis]QFR96870.1 AAA family ATPase [Streptomyces tsukubensis]